MQKLKKNAPLPKYRGDWDKRLSQYISGLTINRSDRCPYTAKSVKEISETSEKRYGIEAKIIDLNNCKEAQSAPSAYAIFSIIYKGKIFADYPISNKRFMNIMDKELRRK